MIENIIIFSIITIALINNYRKNKVIKEWQNDYNKLYTRKVRHEQECPMYKHII